MGLVRGDLWTFAAYVLRAGEVWGKATSIHEIMAPALRKEDKVSDQREACSQQGKVKLRSVQLLKRAGAFILHFRMIFMQNL